MKVALVYDRVNKWGGAERVLLALHELFPKAPLYTSVYNKQKARWASVFDVRTSFLQRFPKASSSHELYAPLMPLAFESFSFDEYDLVISVTSESAKGIITKPQTKHICYCLTPTRYLWSGYNEYFHDTLLRFVTSPMIYYLKQWDKVASHRPDSYISISDEVKKRLEKYYDISSSVVYPPLMITQSESIEKIPFRQFFLVVSRLVPYKRVDLAIKACNALNAPLVVVGVGSELAKLKKIAGPTITFLGSLTDEKLVPYYKQCRALLFPGNEDFGLTMVEAQSFGKPVIAYRAGGAKEIVKDKETGLFFESQTITSLKDALLQFDTMRFSETTIKKHAEQFGMNLFKEHFMGELNRILAI